MAEGARSRLVRLKGEDMLLVELICWPLRALEQ